MSEQQSSLRLHSWLAHQPFTFHAMPTVQARMHELPILIPIITVCQCCIYYCDCEVLLYLAE